MQTGLDEDSRGRITSSRERIGTEINVRPHAALYNELPLALTTATHKCFTTMHHWGQGHGHLPTSHMYTYTGGEVGGDDLREHHTDGCQWCPRKPLETAAGPLPPLDSHTNSVKAPTA